MKLLAHSKERRQDVLTIKCRLRDHFRRPAGLKLSIVAEEQAELDDVLMSGDIRDVVGSINAVAEIAWANGWRPRGLMATVAAMIANFKELPLDK